MKVTVATLSPDQYPPEGQKFFDDFTAKYGEKNPDPYAIYGYEAMKSGPRHLQGAGRGLHGSPEDDRRAVRNQGP